MEEVMQMIKVEEQQHTQGRNQQYLFGDDELIIDKTLEDEEVIDNEEVTKKTLEQEEQTSKAFNDEL